MDILEIKLIIVNKIMPNKINKFNKSNILNNINLFIRKIIMVTNKITLIIIRANNNKINFTNKTNMPSNRCHLNSTLVNLLKQEDPHKWIFLELLHHQVVFSPFLTIMHIRPLFLQISRHHQLTLQVLMEIFK